MFPESTYIRKYIISQLNGLLVLFIAYFTLRNRQESHGAMTGE